MNGEEDMTPEEARDLLAAELALGLLAGDELAAARRLAAADPDFAGAVAAWEERLMPLAGAVPAAIPDPAVWDRVRRAIAEAPAAGANVVDLSSRLRFWRGAAAAAMAVAAALALVVALDAAKEQPGAPVAPAPAPVMVATLSSPEEATSLAVAYDAGDRSLMVTPGRLAGAAGHDHELWIIPAGGSPVSLGLVRAGAPQRLAVPASIAPHFRARAGVALSVEPTGGSPTGQPTGPVIAAGELIVV
jgi:anti-sigma-K factor RskA